MSVRKFLTPMMDRPDIAMRKPPTMEISTIITSVMNPPSSIVRR